MANRLYLLYQFSPMTMASKKARLKMNSRLSLSIMGIVGARGEMQEADWAFFVYMNLSTDFVKSHI